MNMRTVVVTGAGSGMGRATAIALAAGSDTQIILTGRRKEVLEETRSLMNNASAHHIAVLDVRNAAEWLKFFASIDTTHMNLYGVFANAGIGGENHYGEADRWEEIISTNLTGTYVTIMECLPYLKKSEEEYKHIVITSSCLGRFGVPNYTAYCTAKTGLLGLTKSMALQFAADKILVNAICPGWVETEMAKAGIQKLADRAGNDYQKSFDEQMSYVPLNKISQPEEIAALVKWLMSAAQTSMTGQGIDINNGSYML
ncbi:MAG: SDR family NAD(P)-dependent oxidoreductase [Flavobacteriales bacterium]